MNSFSPKTKLPKCCLDWIRTLYFYWCLAWSLFAQFKVLQPWHYWQFGSADSLLWGTVLHTGGWLAVSSTSVHRIPVSLLQWDNQLCLQPLSDVPWRTKSPLAEKCRLVGFKLSWIGRIAKKKRGECLSLDTYICFLFFGMLSSFLLNLNISVLISEVSAWR